MNSAEKARAKIEAYETGTWTAQEMVKDFKRNAWEYRGRDIHQFLHTLVHEAPPLECYHLWPILTAKGTQTLTNLKALAERTRTDQPLQMYLKLNEEQGDYWYQFATTIPQEFHSKQDHNNMAQHCNLKQLQELVRLKNVNFTTPENFEELPPSKKRLLWPLIKEEQIQTFNENTLKQLYATPAPARDPLNGNAIYKQKMAKYATLMRTIKNTHNQRNKEE